MISGTQNDIFDFCNKIETEGWHCRLEFVNGQINPFDIKKQGCVG